METAMTEPKITHPSFGAIRLHRYQGGNRRMFNSALVHDRCIAITISTASMRRDVGTDWVFPENEFIEVLLSEVDFARFIASAGIGEGTPCTISRREVDGKYVSIPEPPKHKADVATFKGEVREHVEKAVEGAKQALADAKALKSKKSVGKGDIDQLIATLTMAVQQIEANAPFYVKVAEESIEKMVTNAKGEIEAFIRTTATAAGLENMSSTKVAQIDYKGDGE